ncbi:MAG: RlpA-like double-psi beta-barrel domain-containing protein [Bacteroidia bacterium]
MGPSKESRIIDLSYAAAEAIGVVRAGVAQVQLDVLEEGKQSSRRGRLSARSR